MDAHSNLILVWLTNNNQHHWLSCQQADNNLSLTLVNSRQYSATQKQTFIMNNESAKFLQDRIRIAHTTYSWTDATATSNFKLALIGKAIIWLNHVRYTMDVGSSTWTNIEPEFINHFNIKISIVDNVWISLNSNLNKRIDLPINAPSVKIDQQCGTYCRTNAK